jgi:hypothetical protein
VAGTASLRALQTYVDEAGNIIAAEEYEPCGHGFCEHPGAAVQCPSCGHLCAQVEKGVEDRPPEGITPD